MSIKIIITLLLTALITGGFAQVQMGDEIYGLTSGSSSGGAISLSRNGTILGISSYQYENNKGNVRIFQWKDSTWKQVEILYGDRKNDCFGFSISLSASGTRLAVGAIGVENDENTHNGRGYTRVFECNGTQWTKTGDDIIGKNKINLSGWAVALSENGNRLAISAPQYSPDSAITLNGLVQVYELENASWKQVGADICGTHMAKLGHSLALSADGNSIAIGALYESYVNVYKLKNNTWEILGDSINQKGFALSFSDNGRKIAIGNPSDDGNGNGYKQGAVRLYRLRCGKWKQAGQTIIGESYDEYGFSLSLSGNGKALATSVHKHGDTPHICSVFQFKKNAWQPYGHDFSIEKEIITFESFVAVSKAGTRLMVSIPDYENMRGKATIYDISRKNMAPSK